MVYKMVNDLGVLASNDHRRRVLNIWRQISTRHSSCPKTIGVFPDTTLVNNWTCTDCCALFPEQPQYSEPCPCFFFKDNDWIDVRVDLALDGKLAGLKHLTYLDREG